MTAVADGTYSFPGLAPAPALVSGIGEPELPPELVPADAARLCDWTGPLRQRYDAESAAVDRVAQDVEQALVHLGLTLGREVDRLRALRRRRPSALPW